MIPKIPVGDWVGVLIDLAQQHLGWLFAFIYLVCDSLISALQNLLLWPDPVIFIAVMMLVVALAGHRRLALGVGLGLFILLNLGLWRLSMVTLSLILSATAIALLIGIPLGILTAWSKRANRCLMPVLDFMQTMPAFVYLVPAVLLFADVGHVPALVAIVIFAMPPVIRLTGLGIRQVSGELIEAAQAFGSTRMQILIKVQFPLATPTIMAGINQCIMLALSMAVIAAMIGAGGLGGTVLRGLMRLDVPTAFEGGLAIVIIAIILDRLTQSVGRGRKQQKSSA
ncbi:MAG: ABC transporter permease subunit [Candidatus Desulforudis sp.]|nr:ABC transporter permease subunit [Desulforudis sp.]